MYNFGDFLQDLSFNTGIKFNLVDEDGSQIYFNNLKEEVSETIGFSISLGNSRANVYLSRRDERCIPILRYTIEHKYSELFSQREQLLMDILQGKDVPGDKIEKNFPFLSKGSSLFLVSVEGSRYEALGIIREIYREQDVLTMIYEDEIIVISNFDEIEEHAKSIREAIVSDLYCRCSVSFADVIHDAKSIRPAYEHAKECIQLGKKFGIKEEVYSYNKMLFEKVTYNIHPKVKHELLVRFKDKFNIFDNELITTIEEFVNSGLNISDAARKLYVHRNTLIYRLDKINKETGFDIRNFKEATVFIIAFLVWKENNRI